MSHGHNCLLVYFLQALSVVVFLVGFFLGGGGGFSKPLPLSWTLRNVMFTALSESVFDDAVLPPPVGEFFSSLIHSCVMLSKHGPHFQVRTRWRKSCQRNMSLHVDFVPFRGKWGKIRITNHHMLRTRQ